MATSDLCKAAYELEMRIRQADCANRIALQPQLSRVLERMSASGQEVPPELRQLNTVLCDEAIEAWFDNMPV